MGGRRRLLLALAAVAALAPAVPALACDSSSCALLTRGQSGTLGKGAFRLDLSFRYTDEDVRLQGSQRVTDVYVPKVASRTARSGPPSTARSRPARASCRWTSATG